MSIRIGNTWLRKTGGRPIRRNGTVQRTLFCLLRWTPQALWFIPRQCMRSWGGQIGGDWWKETTNKRDGRRSGTAGILPQKSEEIAKKRCIRRSGTAGVWFQMSKESTKNMCIRQSGTDGVLPQMSKESTKNRCIRRNWTSGVRRKSWRKGMDHEVEDCEVFTSLLIRAREDMLRLMACRSVFIYTERHASPPLSWTGRTVLFAHNISLFATEGKTARSSMPIHPASTIYLFAVDRPSDPRKSPILSQ